MDMYEKRKQRQNKKDVNNNNEEQSQSKTNINWYPGHMVKAQNEIKSNLKLIDIVVEILDARIPLSSQNPLIDNLAKDKARIVVLNKVDLADDRKTKEWITYFEQRGISCITTNASTAENIKGLIGKIKEKGQKIYKDKFENRNIDLNINHIYRALIVGIPNVGKSTIINKIAKRPVANVGNKPGVTKRKQWIRVDGNIDLLDTPGLLWPRLDDQNAGVKLALTGNIKQEVLEIEDLAMQGIKIIKGSDSYRELLVQKYKLTEEDMLLDEYDILELIGKKRGCLISGGNVNLEKAANLFVEEFKNGKIGRMTLDIV